MTAVLNDPAPQTTVPKPCAPAVRNDLLLPATSRSRQHVDRSAWGTTEWLQDAERILEANPRDKSARLLKGHVVAMRATIIELRAQLEPLTLTESHQIRELGIEAVIRDDNGLVLQKQDDLDGSPDYWVAPGNSDELFCAESIALPVQLLFRHP